MASRNDVQYIRFYTSGSAARKIAPVVSATVSLPQVQPQKKVKRIPVYIDPVAILGIVVAVCMLICMGTGLAKIKTARAQTQQIQQYVQQLSEEKAELTAEYTAGYDLQTVKQTALALGMIPRSQAQRVTLEVPAVQQEQTVTLWSRIGTFLAGLIA